MKDLIAVSLQCESDLARIGIPIGMITGYVVNTRAKSRLGLCSRSGRGYRIEISEVLLRDEVPLDELKNTIYHELIHTCYGCMNHGERWKRYAHKVSAAYGLDIARVADKNEVSVHILNEERKAREPKYKYECQQCGKLHIQYRESSFTRNPECWACGRCGCNKWKRIM